MQTPEEFKQEFLALPEHEQKAKLREFGDLTWEESIKMFFANPLLWGELKDEKLESGSKKYAEKEQQAIEDEINSELDEVANNEGEAVKKQERIIEQSQEALQQLKTLELPPEQILSYKQKYETEMKNALDAKGLSMIELKKAKEPFKCMLDKNNELEKSLDEYGQMDQLIATQRQELEEKNQHHKDKITIFEKHEAGTSKEILSQLKAEQEKLEKNLETTKNREEGLKARINELQKSQKQIAPFVEKLNNMGKTDKEIAEEESKKRQETAGAQPTTPLARETIGQTEAETEQEVETAETTTTTTTETASTKSATTAEQTDAAKTTTEASTEQLKPEQEENKALTETKYIPATWANKLSIDTNDKEKFQQYFKKQNREYSENLEFSGHEAIKYLATFYMENKKLENIEKKAREKVLTAIS